MAYSSLSGGAVTNPSNPRAFGVCDRTGLWVNHYKLQYQYQWAGPQLQNTFLLVRPQSLDKPNEQLRTIVLPIDPPPVLNARTENFAVDEA